MQPENDQRRLARLQPLFAQALANNDWERVGQLDRLIRQSLQPLAGGARLTPQLQAQLAPLKQLYGQALQICSGECQRLHSVLMLHTEHGDGRDAYALAGSVQGVE